MSRSLLKILVADCKTCEGNPLAALVDAVCDANEALGAAEEAHSLEKSGASAWALGCMDPISSSGADVADREAGFAEVKGEADRVSSSDTGSAS